MAVAGSGASGAARSRRGAERSAAERTAGDRIRHPDVVESHSSHVYVRTCTSMYVRSWIDDAMRVLSHQCSGVPVCRPPAVRGVIHSRQI